MSAEIKRLVLTNQVFVCLGQAITGPVSLLEAKKWAEKHWGRADAFVWCEGFPSWTPLAQFQELKPSPQTATVPTVNQLSTLKTASPAPRDENTNTNYTGFTSHGFSQPWTYNSAAEGTKSEVTKMQEDTVKTVVRAQAQPAAQAVIQPAAQPVIQPKNAHVSAQPAHSHAASQVFVQPQAKIQPQAKVQPQPQPQPVPVQAAELAPALNSHFNTTAQTTQTPPVFSGSSQLTQVTYTAPATHAAAQPARVQTVMSHAQSIAYTPPPAVNAMPKTTLPERSAGSRDSEAAGERLQFDPVVLKNTMARAAQIGGVLVLLIAVYFGYKKIPFKETFAKLQSQQQKQAVQPAAEQKAPEAKQAAVPRRPVETNQQTVQRTISRMVALDSPVDRAAKSRAFQRNFDSLSPDGKFWKENVPLGIKLSQLKGALNECQIERPE
ncbi:MAG TPA: DUF4339 domain-containing protein, partial [Bdellovibrionales bacterium]|nr:DUF4339 domain-containing protein [Bdellovibrionales bacterium]